MLQIEKIKATYGSNIDTVIYTTCTYIYITTGTLLLPVYQVDLHVWPRQSLECIETEAGVFSDHWAIDLTKNTKYYAFLYTIYSGKFREVQFSQIGHLYHFMDLIFVDEHTRALYKQAYFGFNYCG